MSDPIVAIDEIPGTEPNPKSIPLYEELFNEDSETDRPCYLPDKPQHVTLTSDHDDSSRGADSTSDSGTDSNCASAITEEQTDILEAEPVGEISSNCADVQEEKEISDDTDEGKRPGSSCEANCREIQDDDLEVKPLPKGSAADGSSVESAPQDGRGLSEHEFQENGFIEGSQDKTSKTHVSPDDSLGETSSQAVGSGSSNPTGQSSENGDKEIGDFVHERGIENDVDTPTVDLIPGKQHPNEDDTSASWRKHKKHFFILSHAGKPIYSRYGDEHKLAGFSATLQAIMSFVENTGDCIRFIRAGDHQFVFLVKGPIYLVSISSTDEPVQALRGQLELLYGQLLLILTKSLDKCFVKNAKFDLRPLLGGTEVVFSSLIHSFSWNPSSFLHSYTCLPLSHTARQAAGAALQDVADSDLLFALLLSGSKVISLVGAQKASLHPDDILLLSNFVSSSESFRTTESFSPVCLPHYNPTAFLYAYIRYLDTDTCLILITTNPGAFFHLKECRARVESFLMEAHVLRDIASSVLKGGLRVEDLPGDTVYGPLARSGRPGNNTDNRTSEATASSRQRVGVGGAAGLWHFIYRSVYLDQYVHSEFSPPLHRRQTQKRLFHAYQMLYSSMHGGTAGSHQMQYRRDENHVLLCWSTADFEFMAAFDPLAEKSSAITVCNRVCQWIRDVESEIFYLGSSPFNW